MSVYNVTRTERSGPAQSAARKPATSRAGCGVCRTSVQTARAHTTPMAFDSGSRQCGEALSFLCASSGC